MSPGRRASKRSKKTENPKPIVLVTGDVVLDCHLYGGVTTGEVSFNAPGTYMQTPGGAALTCKLLAAAADAQGLAYDKALKQWEDENAERQRAGKNLNPKPADLTADRPSAPFDVQLAFDVENFLSLPDHLRSYGLWTKQPAKRDSSDRVWRVERHFGYGTADPSAERIALDRVPVAVPPILTVLDDGGLGFRTKSLSQKAWPPLARAGSDYYLLKMSGPICRGDLWSDLAPVMDRLIVLVSVDDLRREDVGISQRLSWERSAEDTLAAMRNNPWVRELGRAAHVVVAFGSDGALSIHRDGRNRSTAYLSFDRLRLEGQHADDIKGTTYGFQTCLAAAIAYHLVKRREPSGKNPFGRAETLRETLHVGIAAGLTAKRRLLELGHGSADSPAPGFPFRELAPVVSAESTGFVSVIVDDRPKVRGQWTILAQKELGRDPGRPLMWLAYSAARRGLSELSEVPMFQLGKLATVDRNEIQSLRTIEALIRTYNAIPVQEKPLSIGVFGPPGAGKSFGVKELAKGILGKDAPFLEFNLSQFKRPEDLIGPLHRIRDAVLRGTTPVAFWDEFDSRRYKWLQYLLAPMQDGAFQEGEITHPIGKCVFIFAGGTSPTLEEFGVAPPKPLTPRRLARLSREQREAHRADLKLYSDYKLLKGPDFISRLHGFLNVLGPNQRTTVADKTGQRQPDQTDIAWPIRRALLLRKLLKVEDSQPLDIDLSLLYALLRVPEYRHGARSFEKIALALKNNPVRGRLHRSALPPAPSLNREVDQSTFAACIERYDTFGHLEGLAAEVHEQVRRRSRASRGRTGRPAPLTAVWILDPEVDKPYEKLDADHQASNLEFARRIAEHLALINFVVVPRRRAKSRTQESALKTAINRHIDRLAEAEHRGWCAERKSRGWTYAPVRNNARKQHPLLVDWPELEPADQEIDRMLVRSIPDLLKRANLAAVPDRGV